MPLRPRSFLALATALCLVVALASPAAATEATFKRAVSNLLCGPLDILLTPIVAPRAVYTNLQDIDDSTGVRIAWTLPGVAWNLLFNLGGGMLRTFTGVLEIVPGVLLLPFEADMDPIFAPPDRAPALIEEETHLGVLKIGINYM
jgi:hypothetical protein